MRYNDAMENKIKYPRCWHNEVWMAGKPRGKQQYKCQECKRKFITELNYSTEFKQKAIAIFHVGNSVRAVERMLGINESTVYNWIKKLDKKQKVQPAHRNRGRKNANSGCN